MAQSGTVTLLFTDLVDSTRHLQRAGDEAGQRLFGAHHKVMTESIDANGGQELEWLGDGVLAVFSSAADAVRCAILMQHTARRPLAGQRFEIRIGLHAGEALRREGGYFGTPVVTARRLCDRASAGQILCSRLVAELLGSRQAFSFRDLGSFELKGIAAPMGVCEVIYERNDPAALLSRTPFVGRAQQLKRLSAKLEEVCNGQGSVAMLSGEPGIGKTRILEEFADLARTHGALVIKGACYDGEWQPPYSPFAEAIAECARVGDPLRFKAALGNHASTIARIAPALRETLGSIPEPIPLEKDEEERFRLLDAVAQFMIALSRNVPLVLVLDDLHWADRGTVAMLSHVAHFVPANPILLIGAYRDAEVDRKHPLSGAVAGMRRLQNFESLSFKGLQPDELSALLAMVGDQEAPQALVDAIGAETAGNPFFIREVLLHLMEEGKILRDGQGWTSDHNIEELGIPEGVREVVGRRLLRLSDGANRLLSVGAAFNGAFSFEVAAAVAGLDEQTALGAIDEALDAQLLRPGANSESFDFTHAITRSTLYSNLSAPRRVRLHRQIAEAMERAWGERTAEHAAEVAYQFWRGATAAGAERGADYAIAAADHAEAAYAFDEVIAFLRIALDLMPPSNSRRTGLLARLGLALTWRLNAEEALSVAREAGALIAATDGEDAAADYFEQAARAMQSAGLVRGAWELAREGLRHVGERRDITWASLTELDLLRQSAEDPGNPGIRTAQNHSELRGVLRSLPGEQLKEHKIDPPFESRDEILAAPDASVYVLTLLAGEFRRGQTLWQDEAVDAERQGRVEWAMSAWASVAACDNALGNFTAAQAALDRATILYTRSAGPSFQVPSLYINGVKYQMRIAMDQGWGEFLKESDTNQFIQKPAPENNWSFALVRAVAAFLLARLNRPELALQRLETLAPALDQGAFWEPTYGPMVCDAAAALWLLNRTDHAETIERNLRAKVIAPDFRFPMRDSRLSLARLCALLGRYDEALEWFGKARQVLDEQGARPMRAIADYDEALMYVRRAAAGDAKRAEPVLDLAMYQFRALGMTGWIRRAEEARERAALA
jgi:class 3 adenylate cyclase/tetratricopeptide (TPR) repeat protein